MDVNFPLSSSYLCHQAKLAGERLLRTQSDTEKARLAPKTASGASPSPERSTWWVLDAPSRGPLRQLPKEAVEVSVLQEEHSSSFQSKERAGVRLVEPTGQDAVLRSRPSPPPLVQTEVPRS